MLEPTITVAICTHNPRRDVLSRVLEALRNQSLSRDKWDLLVVDNASDEPIQASTFSWNERLRVVREPVLGLTPARLTAIRGANTELLIFVDDDNLLCPEYLENAQRIARDWPTLGAWGGSITAHYEEAPPAWLKSYERFLSVREVAHDEWFNIAQPEFYGHLPYGAGLCVRRTVAEAYLHLAEADEVRRLFDRKGESLASSGDTDLALVSCDLGFGTGLFTSLKLIHVISGRRLTETYIAQLLRGMNYSLRLLIAKRGHTLSRSSWLRRSLDSVAALRRGRREFSFHRAAMNGRRIADAEIRQWTQRQ